MKASIFLALLALPLLIFLPARVSGAHYIYKSPNKIDFVKIVGAKKGEREGGLKHPYKLDPEKIRSILRTVHFNKKVLLKEDLENSQLFQERHVEFLAPYLIEAFQKVGPEEVVIVSFFTEKQRSLLPDDRLTVFRTFVREDGFHLKFTKLYAKLLGDRTTKGAPRAIQEAKGMRVGLEVQPGQNRISWDPEEIVLDLHYKFASLPERERPEKEIRVKRKQTVTSPTTEERPVRERLKELERLKEEELITEKEYQKKRRELLKEL